MPSPAGNNADLVNVACKFFISGDCAKGAACRFLHGGIPAGEFVAAVAAGRQPGRQPGGGGGGSRPASAQRPPRSASAQRPPRPASAQRSPSPAPNLAARSPLIPCTPPQPSGGGGGGGLRSASAQRPARPSSVGPQRPRPVARRDSFTTPSAPAPAPAPAAPRGAGLFSKAYQNNGGGGNSILNAVSRGGSGTITTTSNGSTGSITSTISSANSSSSSSSSAVQQRQQDFLVRLANGQMAAGHMKVTQQVVTTRPPLVVHAYFLVDASGSMYGARMAATLEYLGLMVRSVLSGDDLVTVWTFAAEEKLTQLYYKTQAANIRLEALGGKVTTGGCTRLYGNCVRALDSMRKDDRVRDDRGNVILRNLVVFTDGCDNESGADGLQEMVGQLRKPGLPHFYFTCLAVSEEGYREGQKLQKALGGIRKAKVILTDKASKEEIAQAFGKAQARLREAKQELIERIELECRAPGTTPVLAGLVAGALRNGADTRRLA